MRARLLTRFAGARGRLERVEHVDNARRSAQHVAALLLKQGREARSADDDKPYDYLCAAPVAACAS
jgi:hypothetical protein